MEPGSLTHSPPLPVTRLAFIVCLATLAGCMSSSPRAPIWDDQANLFSVNYAGSAEHLADSLAARGCVPEGSREFRCRVSERDLPVAIRLSRPRRSAPSYSQRAEATEVVTSGTTPRSGDFVAPDGEVVNTVEGDLVRPSSSPRTRSRSGLPRVTPLNVTARVLDGDTLVRLAGEDAEALRASLYALLVRDLPVTTAYVRYRGEL